MPTNPQQNYAKIMVDERKAREQSQAERSARRREREAEKRAVLQQAIDAELRRPLCQ